MEFINPGFSTRFLERYTPIETLETGTHGAIHLMEQLGLKRRVLVKSLRREAISPELLAKVQRDAALLSSATLSSTRLVRTFEASLEDAVPYIVSEWVEGPTLADRLRKRKKPYEVTRVIRLGLRILAGLAEAHDKGIVHGFLSPASVHVPKTGGTKLGDFCIPRHFFGAASAVMHDYRSPECARGGEPSVRGDLYSVAVILMHALGGTFPPSPIPLARAINRDAPLGLQRALARALDPDPKKRFDSARRFRRELLKIEASTGEETMFYYAPEAAPAPVPPAPAPAPAAPAPPPPSVEPRPGMVLNERYELVRHLGESGAGQTWLARDLVMEDAEVEVKLIPSDLVKDPDALATLRQEAKLTQRLAHPNIARLIQLQPGPPPYLLVEHVPGPSLAQLLADRKVNGEPPYTPQEALPIFEGIAYALSYAHEQGIVHRDVAPQNVIIETRPGKQVPRLVDFGLAAEISSFRTGKPGAPPAGTLAYMSPEQQACQRLDHRTDVYSLAATLHHMLTLSPPYSRGNVAWAIANSPPPRIEGAPAAVADAVQKGLAKAPGERWQTVAALLDAYRNAVHPSGVGEVTAPEPVSKTVVVAPPDATPATVQVSADNAPATMHNWKPTPLPPRSTATARPRGRSWIPLLLVLALVVAGLAFAVWSKVPRLPVSPATVGEVKRDLGAVKHLARRIASHLEKHPSPSLLPSVALPPPPPTPTPCPPPPPPVPSPAPSAPKEIDLSGMLPELTPEQMAKLSGRLGRARRGDASAMADVASLFEMGVGVPRNAQVAMRWYRLAARHGDELSAEKVAGTR